MSIKGLSNKPVPNLRIEDLYIPTALLAFYVTYYFPVLNTSFWLDETITYWVSKGSFAEAVRRSYDYQNHSTIYFVYTWFLQKILPDDEWVLRLTNFPFSAATLWLTYYFAKHRFGKGPAICTVLMILCSQEFHFSCLYYRPYVFCLFFFALAAYLLRNRSPSRSSIQLAGLVWGASVAVNVLYVASAPVFAVFLIPNERRGNTAEYLRRCLHFALGSILTIAIALPNIFSSFQRKDNLRIAGNTEIWELLETTFSHPIWCFLGAFAVLAITLLAFGSLSKNREKIPEFQSVWLLFFVCLAVPAMKYGFERFGGMPVNINRYWLWTIFPQSLAISVLSGWMFSDRYVRIYAFVALCLTIYFYKGLWYINMDLRQSFAQLSAASEQNPDCDLIVQSGVVESANASYFDSKESLAYLSTPLARYPLKANVTVVGLTGIGLLPPGSSTDRTRCKLILSYDWGVTESLRNEQNARLTYTQIVKENIKTPCTRLSTTTDISIHLCK